MAGDDARPESSAARKEAGGGPRLLPAAEDPRLDATAEQLMLLLVQNSTAAVGLKALDGRYLLVNDNFRRFGAAGSGAFTTDADLFPAEVARRLARADREVASQGATVTEEIEVAGADGRDCLLVLEFPIRDAESHCIAIAVVAVEVGQQHRVGEIKRALERSERVNDELKQVLKELELHASTDRLTGAWNRRWLEQALLNELSRFERYGHPVSIVVLDLDHFKAVNDRHGHTSGDQVLRELCGRVRAINRGADSLVRWGGEEFVVLCPNTPLSAAALLAERLRLAVASEPFEGVGHLSCSLGVAEYQNGETWKAWFARADQALYRAKDLGRNRVVEAPETSFGVDRGEKLGGSFVEITWRNAYCCNHPTIDAQHRELFVLANDLLAAVLQERPKDELEQRVLALLDKLKRHFRDEEAIIRAAGFPHSDQHAEIHRGLLQQTDAVLARFHEDRLGVGDLFHFLAYELVTKHMLSADRQFFPYVAEE